MGVKGLIKSLFFEIAQFAHHKNSAYEFGCGKLGELNLNYSLGCNLQIFFLLICDGDSYRYTAFYMALLHTEGARGYK